MKASSFCRWWEWDRVANRTRRSSRGRPRRQLPCLEALEGRVVLSVTPQMVLDISPGGASSFTTELVAIGSTTYYTADDGTNGVELWKSDGTAAGTTLVKDIKPGSTSSVPGNLTNAGGTLFFMADDGAHGSELWRSDGTAAGTVMLKDIYPGSTGSGPGGLTNVNGTLFFAADDGTHGGELWKSDGTVAGTTLVKDIFPGSSLQGDPYNGYEYRANSSYCNSLSNVGGTLFFAANDGAYSGELWKSDGTAAGTTLVRDGCNYPSNMTNVGGTLFFTATGSLGQELWKSDGTAAGTTLVKDIYTGTTRHGDSYYGYYYTENSSTPRHLTDVNGTLFFSADDGTNGVELWKSDGTAAGTVMVGDIKPGSVGSFPSNTTNFNGTLFFTAYDGVHGYELWKSAGTAAGTTLVKDIKPGSGDSYNLSVQPNLTNINGTLFFTADDGVHGFELWRSDGTAAGTMMVGDINTGGAGSFPGNLTNAGGTLFFSADDGFYGKELWVLAEGTTQTVNPVVSGFPTAVTAGVPGSVTVTVKNADGTTATGFKGIVRFSSSDPQAALPADYTFTAADAGTRTFSAALKTAGSQSITATVLGFSGGTGTQAGITVNPAAANQLSLAGFPSPITAGVAGNFTVTAWDPYGNRATGYRGTVRFTSSDATAALPGNYAFTATDAGIHTFGATLKSAGTQSLTVTNTVGAAFAGTQDVVVNPAAASRLVLGAPASIKANAQFSLTVTVVDAYGNVVTGFRGTLSFSSSDATANLPGSYTFTAADRGVHTFTKLMLKKKGRQSITATDKLNSSLTGGAIIDVV